MYIKLLKSATISEVLHRYALFLHCYPLPLQRKPKLSLIKSKDMEQTIVISTTVMNRLCNLSSDEKKMLLDTLLCDEVLKIDRPAQLTPGQELIYFMFRDRVMRDSYRYTMHDSAQHSMVS